MSQTFKDRLFGVVRRKINESPNVVYNRPEGGIMCQYDSGVCSDGSVGCIWGQAFRELGLVDDLHLNQSLVTYFDLHDIPVDRLSLAWAAAVQAGQDRGLSWGQAGDLAEVFVNNLDDTIQSLYLINRRAIEHAVAWADRLKSEAAV